MAFFPAIEGLRTLYPSDSRSDLSNDRGVAILPTIGKLFEAIVCDVWAAHFKNYISPE